MSNSQKQRCSNYRSFVLTINLLELPNGAYSASALNEWKVVCPFLTMSRWGFNVKVIQMSDIKSETYLKSNDSFLRIEESIDFVLDPILRQSLDEDLIEMMAAFRASAWKATMVLGGSIVEALLLDYLLAESVLPDYAEASAKNFEDLISTAYKKRLISERVKEQCFLIKRYRNLIHQGRILRTKESCDRHSAIITVALVNMVLTEIAKSRRASYGLTANQFCRKILEDPSNGAVLPHLLKGMKDREFELLLCDTLPAAAFDQEPFTYEYDPFADEQETPRGNAHLFYSILRAYRVVFNNAPSHIKEKTLVFFAKSVKEESQAQVNSVTSWFLRVQDLHYANSEDCELLVDFMLQRTQGQLSQEDVERLKGIEMFLKPKHVAKFIDRLIETWASKSSNEETRYACETILRHNCTDVPDHLVKTFQNHFDMLSAYGYCENNQEILDFLNTVVVKAFFDPFADE